MGQVQTSLLPSVTLNCGKGRNYDQAKITRPFHPLHLFRFVSSAMHPATRDDANNDDLHGVPPGKVYLGLTPDPGIP